MILTNAVMNRSLPVNTVLRVLLFLFAPVPEVERELRDSAPQAGRRIAAVWRRGSRGDRRVGDDQGCNARPCGRLGGEEWCLVGAGAGGDSNEEKEAGKVHGDWTGEVSDGDGDG